MPIMSFDELATTVIADDKKSRIAVVNADDAHTVEAATIAQRDGLAEVILIGKTAEVLARLNEQGQDPTDYKIVDADDTQIALAKAVNLIHSGEANVLMKGHLETGDFMRAILSRDNNLRSGSLLSVAGLFEIPSYHKLIALTDMAVNTYPDLDAKRGILENAVKLLHAVGVENPKVAIIAAIEKLNPKMQETVDADALKTLNLQGQISGCIVDGPLSLDIATSKEAAEIKGYSSAVAGDADLLVIPDLVCGNVLAKSWTGFAGAMTAGVVVGAKVPVVLTPRSAAASDKYYSIALAAHVAKNL